MATKKTGFIDTVKNAVSGLFSDDKRKSPKRVEAGKKAATTRKTNEAVTATKKAVKTAVKKTTTAVKKTTGAKKAPAAKKKA